MDTDSKKYKRIFGNKKMSFEEKLQKAGDYANERVKYRLYLETLIKFYLSIGIFPINNKK